MAELVADCPRCRTRSITFEVTALNLIAVQYDWQHFFEAFSICRHCARATTFVLEENNKHDTQLFRDVSSVLKAPEH